MKATAAWLLWFVVRLPGVGIGVTGVAKFITAPRWQHWFGQWGYPEWFAYVAGVIEILGAILLFVPKTSRYGALLLSSTMLAAAVTLFTHPHTIFGRGSTPLVYCVWLAAVAIVSWRRG